MTLLLSSIPTSHTPPLSVLPRRPSSVDLPSNTDMTLPTIIPTHQALSLFDILSQIQPFLSLQDLGRATQVCRRWHRFFHRVLWRSIAISESRHRPDFIESLVKNLGWVHSLKWDYTEWWEMHHVSRYSLPSTPATRTTTIQPTVISTNRAQTAKLIDVLPVPKLPQSSYPATCSPAPASFLSSSSRSSPSFNPTTSPASPTEAVAGTSVFGARTRLQYHPPTQISFPTRQTLQQLGLNQAHALQDLVLEGPFEMIPLLQALACANQYSCSQQQQQQQQQHRHSFRSQPSFFSPGSNGNKIPQSGSYGDSSSSNSSNSDATGGYDGPRLRRLRLKNTNCQRREAVPYQILFRVSPALEELALKTHAQIIVPEQSKDDVPLQQEMKESPLKLKKLELDVRALTGPQLWVILRQCPDLEMFSLTDYGGIHPVETFKKGLSSLGSFEQEEVEVIDKTRLHRSLNDASLTRTRAMSNIVAWIRSTTGQDSERSTSSVPTAASRHASSHVHASQVPAPGATQSSDAHSFLASLPKLTHLGLDSICFGDVCLSALAHHCPRLTSLDIGRQLSGIPAISPTSPPTSPWFESPLSPSLFSSSPSLTSTPPPSGQIQSSTLQTFLCSPGARHLKHLRIRGLRLNVEDMLCPKTGTLQPWTCSPQLETLSMAFGTGFLSSPMSSPSASPNLSAYPPLASPLPSGFPLLYNHLLLQPSLTLQESLEQIVYRQLALLHQIQILEIRPSASFLRPRISSTSRSGLELLADLNKTLQEFSMAMNVQPQPPPSAIPGVPSTATAAAMAAAEERKALHEWFDLYWPDVKKIQVVSSRDRAFQTAAPSHPGGFGLGITTAAASAGSASAAHCGPEFGASSNGRPRDSTGGSSPGSNNLEANNCSSTNHWKGFLSQPPPPRSSRV